MPLSYLLTLKRQELVNGIVEQVMEVPDRENENNENLSRTRTEEKSGKKEILAGVPQEKAEKEAKKRAGKTGERKTEKRKIVLSESIDSLLTHPLFGIPVLFLVLYFGLYLFVGIFAAGTLVDFLENTVFGEHINP